MLQIIKLWDGICYVLEWRENYQFQVTEFSLILRGS